MIGFGKKAIHVGLYKLCLLCYKTLFSCSFPPNPCYARVVPLCAHSTNMACLPSPRRRCHGDTMSIRRSGADKKTPDSATKVSFKLQKKNRGPYSLQSVFECILNTASSLIESAARRERMLPVQQPLESLGTINCNCVIM